MAIQYRAMYHASDRPIKDHACSNRKIRKGDLVVQSRFVCISGSYGGSTFSFKKWKLPGTLSNRNAGHMTMYKNTRPVLAEDALHLLLSTDKNDKTSNPIFVIDPSLSKADAAQ
eukprot:3081189-Ditylum_brightwellii.AAC.1